MKTINFLKRIFGLETARERLKRKLNPSLFEIISKQLDDEQIEVFESMYWLLDKEKIGKGRSRVIAMFFIAQAEQHRGRQINVFDNHPDIDNRRNVVRLIERILCNYPKYRGLCAYFGTSFMMSKDYEPISGRPEKTK